MSDTTRTTSTSGNTGTIGVDRDPGTATRAWYYSQVKDWMVLSGELSHVDLRLYALMRSLTANAPQGRRLSRDQIRWLMPGVRGKRMCARTLDDALARLDAARLVTADPGNVNTRRERGADGRWHSVDYPLWHVHELPAEADGHRGWASVQEGMAAYPGPGWTERPLNPRPAPPAVDAPGTDPATPTPDPGTDPGAADATRRRGQRPPARADDTTTRPQQPHPAEPAAATARTSRKKSAPTPRRTARRTRKLAPRTTPDQRKHAPTDRFSDPFSDPAPQAPREPAAPDAADTRQDEAGRQAPPPTLEHPPTPDDPPTPDPATADRADALIADLAIPPGATPPTPHQRATLLRLVAALWAHGVTSTDIRTTATRRTDDVRWAGSVWIARLEARLAHERLNPRTNRPAPPVRPAESTTDPAPAPAADDSPARQAARDAVANLRRVHHAPRPLLRKRRR